MEKHFPKSTCWNGYQKSWLQKKLLRHILLKFSKSRPKKEKKNCKFSCKNKNNLVYYQTSHLQHYKPEDNRINLTDNYWRKKYTTERKYIPSQKTVHLSGKKEKKNLQKHKDSEIISVLYSVKNTPKITLLKMNQNWNLKKGIGDLIRKQQEAVKLAKSCCVHVCTRVYESTWIVLGWLGICNKIKIFVIEEMCLEKNLIIAWD